MGMTWGERDRLNLTAGQMDELGLTVEQWDTLTYEEVLAIATEKLPDYAGPADD